MASAAAAKFIEQVSFVDQLIAIHGKLQQGRGGVTNKTQSIG